MNAYDGFRVIADWQEDKTLIVIGLEIMFHGNKNYENVAEFLDKRDVKLEGYTDVSQIKTEFSKKFFGQPEEEIEVVDLNRHVKTFR